MERRMRWKPHVRCRSAEIYGGIGWNEPNNASFTGAEWDNVEIGLLKITVQNVQVGSTFDLTKLTYSDGNGCTYKLAGTYTQVNMLPEAQGENYGKYFFDSGNNKLIVNLTEVDYNKLLEMPDCVVGTGIVGIDTISAQAGWNTYNSIAASAVTAKSVTVQS